MWIQKRQSEREDSAVLHWFDLQKMERKEVSENIYEADVEGNGRICGLAEDGWME